MSEGGRPALRAAGRSSPFQAKTPGVIPGRSTFALKDGRLAKHGLKMRGTCQRGNMFYAARGILRRSKGWQRPDGRS
jgi:hypothetical protein